MRFFLRIGWPMDSAISISYADLSRVNVVGTSSSGKSTLSKRLAATLDVPYIEMDLLYHGPDWTEPEPEVFRERIENAVSESHWVLDGNYHSKTADIKWSRATLILWLDVAFPLNMLRATKRAIQRSWSQKELWSGTGNCETFRRTFFSSDSMILWTAMSHGRLRKRYESIESDPPEGLKFIRLKTDADVDFFIEHAKKLRAAALCNTTEIHS